MTMRVVLRVRLSSARVALQQERLWAELFSASAPAPRTRQAAAAWLYLTGTGSGPETAGKIFTCGKCSGILNSLMDGKGVWWLYSLLAHFS